jgi:C-terminal processing protease CtpA/Prc
MRALLALTAAITLSCALAPSADAQEETARTSVPAAAGRSRVPYTGMNISGQPRFENGTFRWVTHPRVATVEPGSPAYKVGIRPGDVVVLVNGVDARVPETMMGQPGKVYVFRIRRGSEVRDYTLTSTTRPTLQASGGTN